MYGIDEQLLKQKYYVDRLSMFMKESLGIIDRTNFGSGLLIRLSEIQQEIYERLNIVKDFDGINSYYSDWLTNSDKDPFGYEDFFLDTIGSIINCPRSFTVNYSIVYTIDTSTEPNTLTIGGITYDATKDANGNYESLTVSGQNPILIQNNRFEISSVSYGINQYDGTVSIIPQTTIGHTYSNKKFVILNNYEYLFYLLVQITKSHYFGTREELNDLYNPEKLNFVYVPTGNPCEVNVYWDTSSAFGDEVTPSVDLLYTFLDGKLTVESMGIVYNKVIGSPYKVALWDVSLWDYAYWQYKDPIVVSSGIFGTSVFDSALWG